GAGLPQRDAGRCGERRRRPAPRRLPRFRAHLPAAGAGGGPHRARRARRARLRADDEPRAPEHRAGGGPRLPALRRGGDGAPPPPRFERLARLVVRSKDEKAAEEYANRLADAFRPALAKLQEASAEPTDLRLLGPAEAPVFRLKGYYRFHFQLQSSSSAFL